jgi:integration host factor subunit alpha
MDSRYDHQDKHRRRHMALTKNDLVAAVNDLGFTKKKSVDIIEGLIEIMKSTLAQGEDVLVSGFGKFSVKEKRSRRGRNPATGDDLMLRERKVVTFKCSGKLREKINGGAGH